MLAGLEAQGVGVSLPRSGVLFFAPTGISDDHFVGGEKPSKREGHPNPSLTFV